MTQGAGPDSTARYNRLKRAARQAVGGDDVGRLLVALTAEGFAFLTTECNRLDLTSQVDGKSYVAFQRGDRLLF